MQCRLPAADVDAYLAEVGPRFFAPFEAMFTVIAHYTRTALVMSVVMGESTRARDADELVKRMLATSSVLREARPAGTGPDHLALLGAQMLGGAFGAIAGTALGVLVFGALFGLGLRKLGFSAKRAAVLALASLPVVVLLSAALTQWMNGVMIVQLVSYVALGALAYRPLLRWLERHPRPPRAGRFLQDTAGLSTLEYAVIFAMVCVAGLVIWGRLGKSLANHLSEGESAVSAELARSATANANVLERDTPGLAPATGVPVPALHGKNSAPASAAPSPRNGDSPPFAASTLPPAAAPGQTPGRAPGQTVVGAPGQGNRAVSPSGSQGLLERVKAATIDNPAVQQFTREHPIATAIGKEAAIVAAETFIPGVAAINAVRTLADDKASTFDKAMAGVTLATSIVPPLAAAIKGAKEAATIAKTVSEVTKTTQGLEKASQAATESARAIDHAVDAEKAAAHAVAANKGVSQAAEAKKAAHAAEAANQATNAEKAASHIADAEKAATVQAVRKGSDAERAAAGSNRSAVAEAEQAATRADGAPSSAPPPRVRSVYKDGTRVLEGQQPPRIAGPESTAEGAHSVLRHDKVNNRVYQAREYDGAGNPVRDVDFTNPTYPNGRPRPGHPGPPHQHKFKVNDPEVGPRSGHKRGGPESIP